MATTINLNWIRGDTRAPQFTCTDANGNPLNLTTAATVKFTVRSLIDNSQVLQKTKALGEIVISGVNDNIATVAIDFDDTKTWDLISYKYDLEAKLVGTEVVTPAIGVITITEDQTYV